MAKIQAKYDAFTHASANQVFELLSNLNGYRDWLGGSRMFRECHQLADGPPIVGARYVDRGAVGELQGEIVVCDPPTHIRFEEITELENSLREYRLKLQLTTPFARKGVELE